MPGVRIEGVAIPWRDRARAVQLRILGRFRVAVDRHSQWSQESNYTPAIQRWIQRARSMWEASSSSSSSRASAPGRSLRFYRKQVDKNVGAIDDSMIVRMLQGLLVPVIGNACHVFMHGLNRVQIYGAEKLHQALLKRPKEKPLITVSNHVAAVDDPFVIASLLPPNAMLDAHNLRWTLCATERCFKNSMLSAFFRCVKVLPVSRGDGLYQKGMDMAISKLNNGGWVHIFPEGSRSRDGGRTIGSPKRGVGRLVMDADSLPIVIPFVHTGMQDIMPIGAKFPKIGQRVIVLVGDPIHFEDLLSDKDEAQIDSRGDLYDAVSSRIGHRLQELKLQVDKLALEQPLEVQEYYADNARQAYGIWNQIDWEASGIENFMPPETANSKLAKPSVPSSSTQPLSQPQKTEVDDKTIRMGFSHESRIVSRVRGYMNPTELMGFAARGLFINDRLRNKYPQRIQEASRVRTWKEFLEGNWFDQWNSTPLLAHFAEA